jgi:hypothetical protein
MLTFSAFCDKLSLQGLQYNPEDCKYKGDRHMRVNTKRGKSAPKEGEKRGRGRLRTKNDVMPEGAEDDVDDAAPAGRVTIHQFKQEKKAQGRLCGDKASITTTKHELKCRWCGKNCYTKKCTVCKMPCHDDPKKGEFKGYQCVTELHNDVRFGLAIKDSALLKTDKNTWTGPTEEQKEANSRHINNIQCKCPYNLRRQVPTVEDSI